MNKKLALAAGLTILLIALIAIVSWLVLSYIFTPFCIASGNCLAQSTCSSDSDCVLAYAGETACGSCNQMGSDYKCVSPLEAEILQQKRLLQWGGSLPKCGVCLSNAECVCTGGKCEKIPRTSVEKCNQNSDCVLGYSEGGCSCNEMGANFKCVSPEEAARMKAEWYSKKIACEKCLPEEVVGAECICSSGECEKIPVKEQAAYCEQDSDCVLAFTASYDYDCCDTGGGFCRTNSMYTAVNKGENERLLEWRKENCTAEVMGKCPSVILHKCVLEEIQSKYSTPACYNLETFSAKCENNKCAAESALDCEQYNLAVNKPAGDTCPHISNPDLITPENTALCLDQCNIHPDAGWSVTESQKTNYSCEQNPLCEWRSVFGDAVKRFVCCPKKLYPEPSGHPKSLYRCYNNMVG